MLSFNDYKRKFTTLAINEGFEQQYIERCLKYAECLNNKCLPIIYDTEHFALLVGYAQEYIRAVAQYAKAFYWSYKIKKINGGERIISEPLPNLKDIQFWILKHILYKIKVSPYAKAYIPGKSIKENVRFHRRQKIVLAMDLTDFFGSIKQESISNIFLEMGYTKMLSDLFAKLCCLDGKLPQGAPTSPYLSNIFMASFDDEVSNYCRQDGRCIRYTRYADDLTFSGDFIYSDLISFIREQAAKFNLRINERKTKVMYHNQPQIVTGIGVNDIIQVPKKLRRQIRLQMHFIQKYGIESHLQKVGNERKNFINHLLGQVNFVLSITPNNQEFVCYKSFLHEILKGKQS